MRKLNSWNSIQFNLIDGAFSKSIITNLQKNYLCNILNVNSCDSDLKNIIMAQLENIQHTDNMTIFAVDVSHLITLAQRNSML